MILWGIVWGFLTLVTMIFTIEYYLPELALRTMKSEKKNRAQQNVNDCPEANKEALAVLTVLRESEKEEFSDNTFVYERRILKNAYFVVPVLAACTAYAFVCGMMAYDNSASVVSLVKMTLGMAVLACVFVTDMELMKIPNICSIVLLAGRVLTVVYEFIWVKDEALSWLLNSIIAAAASFVVLFIVMKLTKGGVGMGDIKILSSLGFLCGILAVFYTLVISVVLCAVVSTALLIFKKKKMKDSLPLGPFMYMGFGITVLLSVI